MSLLSEFLEDTWDSTGGALGREIDRFVQKITGEAERVSAGITQAFVGEQMVGGLSGAMTTSMTTPQSSTIPIRMTSGETVRRPPKGKGSSFGETILTGDLVPTTGQKKRLLG